MANQGTYIFADNFNGDTWTSSIDGTTKTGSSGVTNTLPSSTWWNVLNAGNSPNDFGDGDQEYYTNSTSVIYQDGLGNLVFACGKQGTDGATSGTWPTGRCDTSSTGQTTNAQGSAPKVLVPLNGSCEFRIKYAALNGCWPAAWFQGVGHTGGSYPSDYSEFDLFEAGDQNAGSPSQNFTACTAWGPGASDQQNMSAKAGLNTTSKNVSDGSFHVYRLDFYPTHIDAYIDGALFTTITQAEVNAAFGPVSGLNPAYGGQEWPYAANNGFWIILNVAVNSTVTGTTPAAGSLPQTIMTVDYVRVWATAGPDPNSTGAATQTSGSVALGPLAVHGTAASAVSGNIITTGSVALGPLATSGTGNTGTGGGGGGGTIALTDAFGTNDTATVWANSYGTFAVGNGWCSIQADTSYSSGIVSTNTYDLTGSYIYGQFLPYQASSSELSLQVYLDANDKFEIGYSGGTLFANTVQGGTETDAPANPSYNAQTMAWWRIREQTGVVYFDYSADGANWVNYWSHSYTMAVTAIYVYVVAGDYGSDATGTAYCTNINVAPAAMSSFYDGFDTNDLSTSWSWSYGTTGVAGSRCSIEADTAYDSGIITSVTYNLTGSSVAAEMLPYISSSAETGLQVFQAEGSGTGPTSFAIIRYTAGKMQGQIYQGSTLTSGPTVTYNATNHAWWRIREASGTLYFETSPDSLTWTPIWTRAYTFSVTSLAIQVYAGTGSGTGTSYVTNVNVPVTVAAGSVALGPMAVSGTASSTTGSATTSSGSVALGPLVIGTTSATVGAVFSLTGTPTLTRATSGSVTAVFGTGQTDTAGDLLIAVATSAAATSTTAIACSTSGWTQIVQEGNSATAHARVSFWFKVAAGSDTAPTFTSTLSGTGAMTATLYELSMYDATGTTGWLDSYGVYASGGTAYA